MEILAIIGMMLLCFGIPCLTLALSAEIRQDKPYLRKWGLGFVSAGVLCILGAIVLGSSR